MCLDCNAELQEQSVVTPRGRLTFGGSPADAAAAASGPRGPWKNIAKGGVVHSPSEEAPRRATLSTRGFLD